jgi:[acyl-carrier-protein] S-malonyltransferase
MTSTLAYLFPGQGAQAVGMGKAFYDAFDEAKEIYRKAKACLGFDVAALCFEGPQEMLTRTEQCQPAMFTTSLAGFAAFLTKVPGPFQPVAGAGLSLGELTALAAAKAFALEDGFFLIKARGEAMAQCAAQSKGAMLAVIGLSKDLVDEVCRESGAWGANYYTPEQVVLSGTAEAIEKAEAASKARGAKRAIRLEVAGAFHSPLMQPAADAFKTALAKVKIRPPVFPVVSNATAKPTQDPAQIRELLVRQIVSPVLWEPSVRAMAQAGATTMIEFPPARVLVGMVRKIDGSIKGMTIDEPDDLAKLSGILP